MNPSKAGLSPTIKRWLEHAAIVAIVSGVGYALNNIPVDITGATGVAVILLRELLTELNTSG